MYQIIKRFDMRGPSDQAWMPNSAKILRVAEHFGNLCIWYQHDADDFSTRAVRLNSVATGEEYDADLGTYIGTVIPQDGTTVWHILAEGL